MNRGHAYSILARELAASRQLGYECLLAMIGQKPVRRRSYHGTTARSIRHIRPPSRSTSASR